MITVFSPDHEKRNVRTELENGQLVEPHERPERARIVLDRVRTVGLGDVVTPDAFGLDPVLKVHDRGLMEFLSTVEADWAALGREGEAIPSCWPARRMVHKVPRHVDGKLGYYAMASETSIGPGTWAAAQASKDVALTAARLVSSGARAAFGLCRPPGHHAAYDLYGGYCFINNAAVAAQAMRDAGAARVAILDVDFHHGNGTQDIFYARDDVLFLSIHGDPADAFPHFLGYADETGTGAGEGYNVNYPLPPGTAYDRWSEALEDALGRVRAFGADALVISLGVDTFERDPISFFRLTSADFTRYGERIGRAGLPTLFLLEGGYAIAEIGVNAVNVLTGFEQA